jgi:hypothetical protein
VSKFEASLHFLEAGLLQPAFVYGSLFGATVFFRRRGLDAPFAMGAALAAVGIAALAVFWLAWWCLPGHKVAAGATIIAIAGGVASAGVAFLRRPWTDETAIPIALALIATLALLLWVHVGHNASTPLWVAAARWTHPLQGDNAVPLNFAQAMATGRLPVGEPSSFFGDWLSSDRPPLQTSLFLVTPGHLFWGNSEQGYQSAAVAFQMLALVGAWTLARSMGAGQRIALASMAGVFFTPVVLVNGAYVWPKLLAATFVLVAAAIHFSPGRSEIKQQARCGVLVGLLSCLSMLSHGGSAFALIGIAIATLMVGRLGSLRYVAGALVAFTVIYAPWAGYQRFVDPPGNRLLKWQLAGVVPIDPRGFWQTIEESYAARTWDGWVSDREANFGVVTDPGRSAMIGTLESARDVFSGNRRAAVAALKPVRDMEFFHFVPGTGPLGLALYLLPIGLLDRKTRAVTLAIILSLAAWILLMFLPSSTVIHQGSLFPEIALIIVAIAFTAKRSVSIATGLIAVHVLVTAFQYTM